MIFEETVSSSKFAIAILLYKQHIVQCTFLHPFKIRISYYSAGRRNSKLYKKNPYLIHWPRMRPVIHLELRKFCSISISKIKEIEIQIYPDLTKMV